MATRSDIVASHLWFTNEDRRFVFTIDIGDGTTPEDLSGWAMSWVVKRRVADGDASAIITKSTGAGGIVLTSPASGVCTVTVQDTDTASLAPGLYHHELKRTDDGFESPLSFGTAVLQRSLHKGA